PLPSPPTIPYPFFFQCSSHPPHLPSFPTRRSSDLSTTVVFVRAPSSGITWLGAKQLARSSSSRSALGARGGSTYRRLIPSIWSSDRKSTRLNSSHVAISYAVFCLKKKKTSGER